MFLQGICKGKVSTILAVTRCENDSADAKNKYKDKTLEQCKKAHIYVQDVVCLGMPKKGELATAEKSVQLRKMSKDNILKSIDTYMLKEPWRVQDSIELISTTLAILWNIGADVFKYSMKVPVDKYIQSTLEKCGQVLPEEALSYATKITISQINKNSIIGKLLSFCKGD